MLAKHALYQLSYGPVETTMGRKLSESRRTNDTARLSRELVGPGRLELPTLRLSGVRSNQLSYGPMAGARYALEPDPNGTRLALGFAIKPHNLKPGRGPGRLAMGGKRSEDGGALHLFSVFRRPNRPREVWTVILRKEVIQPQVPLRLPCYDFTPVADPTVVACLSCELAQRLRVKPTPMV
jgi:hypothetical protein